jgi:hypothetical protein
MLALIRNGVVAEQRDIEMASIPAHKQSWWRPVEGDEPPHDPRIENKSGPVLTIEPTRVLRQWNVVRKPLADQQQAVKDEARRRIIAAFPDWKQTNMVARGVELQDVWRRTGSWTTDEQVEADALQAAWDWIKSIRDASDVIEALDPIPADFDADARWPAYSSGRRA